MSIENIFDKVKLISELKKIHTELFEVYKKLFDFKYKNDEDFKIFIDSEYKENGVGSKEKKAWNDNFCHRASYTLLNKILFVRICEDKGFMLNPEDYMAGEVKDPHIGKKLSKIGLQKWSSLVTNYTLGELVKFAFNDMKKSYNNIILYKEDKYEILNPNDEEFSLKYIDGDETLKTLIIELEKVLNDIIEKLDTNNFNFKHTDGNVLGDVYEKFMDRETRKAVGQFYTPEFVIEYILKNTVSEADVVENPFLTVADISCGSGHFLIMAYDILKEKFLSNLEKLREKYADEVYKIKKNGKEQELTGNEYWEKENVHYHILKHCIYGADIDSFAVQLTTINLLLKDLDNFTDELNIIECDSLIKWEEDYEWQDLKKQLEEEFEIVITTQTSLFGEEEKFEQKVRKENYKLKYKDISGIEREEIINREKAVEIVNTCEFWSERFDYVVGNPPYVRQEKIKFKNYLESNYEIYNSTADLLTYFIERGVKKLNDSSKIGVIISDKFTRANYGRNLRTFIIDNCLIKHYKDSFDNVKQVFDDATVDSAIMIIQNKECNKTNEFIYNDSTFNQENLSYDGWYFSDSLGIKIKANMDRLGIKIKEISDIKINYGIKTGFNKAFVIDYKTAKELIDKDINNNEIIVKLLRGRDIDRYSINFNEQYLINTKFDLNIEEKYPVIFEFLEKYKSELSKRTDKGKCWYNLRACDYYEDFEKEKIIYPDIAADNRFYYDDEKYYVNNTVYILSSESLNLKYLSGLLNSFLFDFYYKMIATKLSNNGRRYFKIFVEGMPIILNSDYEQELIKNIDILLEKELYLEKLNLDTFCIYERNRTMKKIEKEKAKIKINQIVYSMYNLTPDEIIYVEKNSTNNISKEKEEYFKELNREEAIIQDIFKSKYIDELSNILTPEIFIQEHIDNNKSIEQLAKEYNYEYTTVALLREKYAREYCGQEFSKFYNLSDFCNYIEEYIKNKIILILKNNKNYITLDELVEKIKEENNDYNELISILRKENISKNSKGIIKDIINCFSDTWNSYIKNKMKDKKSKDIIKYYDKNYYGLAEWSDEIHKKYFLNAIDEHTTTKPNEKKAKDILKIFKDLDIEDKEDYIDIIEGKTKRAFN